MRLLLAEPGDKICAKEKPKKETRLTELENPRQLRSKAGMKRRRHQRNLTNVVEEREQRHGEEDEYHQEEDDDDDEDDEEEEAVEAVAEFEFRFRSSRACSTPNGSRE